VRECSGGKPKRAAKAMSGNPSREAPEPGSEARPHGQVDGAEAERMCCDPKDGELCPGKVKPVETLVEACSGSDVQIDRVTWV
jgi:hypothetical protein